MKGLSWSLALLLVPVSLHAAEWVPVGDRGEPLSVRVLEASGLRTVLEYEVGGFERKNIEIEGDTYHAVGLTGEPKTFDRGFPELPRVCRSVIIPDDRRVAVRVLERRYEDVGGIRVVPSKGILTRNVNPAEVPYVFDEFYGTEGWYPAQVATREEPYILRDYRGVVVFFHPFQYNPATGTLRVTTYLRLEVVPVARGITNVLERRSGRRNLTRDFARIYDDHFLNFRSVADERRGAFESSKYTPVEEQGEMLVIAYDSYSGAAQPLVDWKNEMGMRTRLFNLSGIGSEPIEIKNFIRAYYDTTDLVFVLLVGDGGQLPPMHVNDDAASDPRYSLLYGSDYYPEIIVGRVSAELVPQVETQVERTIEYEKYPQAGAEWYHWGVGIGSAEGPGDDGEMDWEHIENIRLDLLGYTYTSVDQIYDPGATGSQVTMALETGRSILNYCGHGNTTGWGTTGFTSYWVNQLENDNLLPFIFDVACLNGNFEATTCFAEAWMRATNNGEPTGAIGIYASSVNQSWNPPMAAQDEMNDLLVQDAKRTFGGLCYNGSMQMMDEYGWDGSYMFKTWHVFGDPSLRVRTDTPTMISPVHDGTISPSASTYVVTVTGEEGILCGLSYSGAYLGSSLTDPTGVATIQIEADLPENEDITLTVTGYNRTPAIETVHVQGGPAPGIRVDPDVLHVLLQPDESFTRNLSIENDGESGSLLNFQITIGDGSITWLAAEPETGTVVAGEAADVDLTFDAAGLEEGEYFTDIFIDNNAQDRISVSVQMTVQYLTEVAGESSAPARLALVGNWPNPFNPTTTVSFTLPKPAHVRLDVYLVSGRHVRTLADRAYPAGVHRVAWDGTDAGGVALPAGIYLCRMEADGAVMSHKMVMAK